jgi:hypothetical protein
VLIEHRWAVPLYDAVDRADGIELSNDWIRPEEVLSMKARLPADDRRLSAGEPGDDP